MKTLVICLAVLSTLLTGCVGKVFVGSGRVITETRPVSNFDSLSLSGIGEVIITQGDSESLTVEAEDNIMPYLKTEVRNGTLYISMDSRAGVPIFGTLKPIRFNVSVRNLKSVDLSGAGRILSGGLKSDRLTIRISGAGSVALDHIEATALTSTLSGVGSLKVVGQVVSQAANLSGVGSYDAAGLSSQTASVSVSGTGGATVWAQDSLDVIISGTGGVNYYGSPRIQKTVVGVGGVKSLGSK